MKEKKEIKIKFGTVMCLVLIIIILMFAISIKIINSNGKNSENELKLSTIEDIKAILNKSNNITNYKCSYFLKGTIKGTTKEYNTIVKYKDNIQVQDATDETGKGIIEYTNYNDNTLYIIGKEEKVVIKRNTLTEENNKLKNENIQILNLLNSVKPEEFSYLGEEKYNNNSCEVVEINKIYDESYGGWLFSQYGVLDQDNEIIEIKYKLWIDKESGAIIKRETAYKDTTDVVEYNYEFNCVTDEDVKLPDFTGYTLVEQ